MNNVSSNILNISSAVHIAFERSEYSVLENVGSVEACAVITGRSFSKTLFLKLYTIQDTATGITRNDYHTQAVFSVIKTYFIV